MVAPKLTSAIIRKEVPGEVLLYFDSALEEDVAVPLTSFQINFGKFVISGSEFRSNAIIVLNLSPEIKTTDELFLSYNPPNDLNFALRGPVKDANNMVQLKRAAVRQITNFEILNLIESDEVKARWNTSSNLTGDNNTTDNYPIRTRGVAQAPTPDDFILMFGQKEAIQISNIDDASATAPNLSRIWIALQDACALIDSYVVISSRSCFSIVSSNRRRTACIIARYYLDSVRRRKDVTDDYERCLKEIKSNCDEFKAPVNPGDELAKDTPQGIMRVWRIPQMYNSVSGKGLSGWWTDSASGKREDWRGSAPSYNSEENNDEFDNFEGASRQAQGGIADLTQPADSGDTTNS